jgi:hypothetical protein
MEPGGVHLAAAEEVLPRQVQVLAATVMAWHGLAPWDGMKTWKNMDLFEANSMVKRCEKCILLANWIGMKSGYAHEFT